MHKRLLFIVLTIVLAILLANSTYSEPRKSSQRQGASALIWDNDTRIDINNLEMFVYNDGNFAYDNANVLGKTEGLYFPRGTKKTVVYAAGLWIGAKVNGSPRVAIAEYSSEYLPGPMVGGTFQQDNAKFRCYKIRKGDTEFSNADYANWPVSQGAPVDGFGKPAILGNQMIWSVFNDADPSQHHNDAGSTEPLGIEIQHSVFGFVSSGALGNTCFLKYKIINKGSNNLQDTYVSIWADPDLGDATDDLDGCDTLLNLGYCYNDGSDAIYGAAPPAVGFELLQGPIVPASPSDSALTMGYWRRGYRNLPMTAFAKYINGTDPASRIDTYGFMMGLRKDPVSGDLVAMVNPVNNQPTTYAVSGDPVVNSGWVDEAAGDRRMVISSGPFNMVPGDTQEVIVAVLVAQGNSPTNSISVLRSDAIYARGICTNGFGSAALPQCGDANWSGGVNLADVIYLLDYVFDSGPAPVDPRNGDVNCDGHLSMSDCVSLIFFLYAGASAPCSHCSGR